MMQEKVSFFYSQKKIGNKLIDSWEFARWTELGLTMIQNFITEDEEKEIVENIPKSGGKNHKGRNSIFRYGSKCYDNYLCGEIPAYLLKIFEKIVSSGLLIELPDHVTVNSYGAGGSIPAHIDNNESGNTITILSLLSDAEMLFEKGEDKFFIPLPRRSLIQMQGKIRWEYNHSIPKIENQRYSIVFRNSSFNN